MNGSEKLIIKSFNINKVDFADKTYISQNALFIRKNIERDILKDEVRVRDIKIKIIRPQDHNIYVNSIMDFFPIAVKVDGKLGEGTTYLITGVVVMLTGSDECKQTVGKFGWAPGVLKDIVYFNRSGTPSDEDIIINIDVLLKYKNGIPRTGPSAVHRVSDKIIQEMRDELKSLNPDLCSQTHEFANRLKPNDKKKVIIIKQVAGQGSMYDNQLFPHEPCGFIGGRSIIDMGNMPVVLTPNQYRDGALRAMT